jgi:hypothetical protein
VLGRGKRGGVEQFGGGDSGSWGVGVVGLPAGREVCIPYLYRAFCWQDGMGMAYVQRLGGIWGCSKEVQHQMPGFFLG